MNNMKRISLFSYLILCFCIFPACNKDKISVEVIKDCTGVYLRENGLDRFVCNDYILDSYESGSHIKVKYDVLELCFGLEEGVACMMVHQYYERIEITKVY